nr:MAG TPA: hypothetical protein [Caudoviricetes sp.]
MDLFMKKKHSINPRFMLLLRGGKTHSHIIS